MDVTNLASQKLYILNVIGDIQYRIARRCTRRPRPHELVHISTYPPKEW